jgi:hypothetical protein
MRRNLFVSALPLSVATLLLALISNGATATASTPAVASGTSSIAGEVMSFSYEPGPAIDDPLPGVRVSVLSARTGILLGSAVTDASGDFHVSGLPAGPVKVRGAKTGWLTTYYNRAYSWASADVITLAAGRTSTLPGALGMDAEAVVQGQVLSWMDPLGGATVTVLDATTGRPIRSAIADVSGYYRIGGLHAGTIKVRASKTGYLTGYADATRSLAAATVFRLVAGQMLSQRWSPSVSLYLDLTPEAVLQGQVLGAMDPLGSARVTVLDAVTGRAIRSVTTDGDGRFRIGGLSAGTVKVRASKEHWVTAFADSKSSLATADVLTLEANWTVTLSWNALDLRPAAVVVGTVRASGRHGHPLAGARVVVLDARTGAVLRSTVTSARGTYRFYGLTAYVPIKVRASAWGFATAYYGGAHRFRDATVITPGPDYDGPTVITVVLHRVLVP